MVGKIIVFLITMSLLVFSFAFFIDSSPQEPVNLKVNHLEPKTEETIDYGDVPVFGDNMRFNHNLISYSIEDACDDSRKEEMIAAFNIFSKKVGDVFFYEDDNDSDIKVGCSNKFIKLGGGLFAAGEGGPSEIINTSGFKVIEEGKILLYNSQDCDYPTVALHELCHVFGFAHTKDPKNIMYPTSDCSQRMSDDMINLIKKLYSIPPLPDVRAGSINGSVTGKYLNFNITVLDEGLTGVDSVELTIYADDKKIDDIEIGKIDIGYGRSLNAENMIIPRNTKILRFVLDENDLIRELDEDNNVIEMTT